MCLILNVLQRYIDDDLDAKDIYAWASELELREDVHFGEDDGHVFRVIFKLSTPELEGQLTQPKAEKLIKTLTTQLPTENDIDKAYE